MNCTRSVFAGCFMLLLGYLGLVLLLVSTIANTVVNGTKDAEDACRRYVDRTMSLYACLPYSPWLK